MRARLLTPLLVALLVAGLSSARLGATDGYFSHGFGTQSKAMAGAGVALVFGAMTPATNPASLVFDGKGIDFGVGIFAPSREYDVTGKPSGYPGTFGLAPGVVKSDSPAFLLPHAGLNWQIGKAATFGLAMYGNGGMNTNYNAPTFGITPTGVNLMQMFIAPTLAMKVAPGQGIGVTPILGYARFEAKGLAAFSAFSSDPAKLTNNNVSSAFGGGVRIGYLGEVSRYLSIGAAYQTRIYMGKFDKYAGLFAQAGGFDVPSNWTVGFAVKPNDKIDVAFDVQQVRYSEINSIGNQMLPNLAQSRLGTDNGAGFGWNDMTTIKTGLQYRASGGWTWRGGYSYGKQPIPSSEVMFNILAPGVIQNHASFGFSKEVGPGKAFNAAVTRAFATSVSGPNPLEAPGAQQIKLTMSQWDVEFGLSIKF